MGDYNPFEDDCNDTATNDSKKPLTKKRKLSKNNNNKSSERHYCSFCSKSFMQNCHLSRHVREKHSKNPCLFECRICDKAFNQRSNLKVHLRSHALDDKVSRPWLCTECYPNRRFTRKSSLKRHWLKKHKTLSTKLISELDQGDYAKPVTKKRSKVKYEKSVSIKKEQQ